MNSVTTRKITKDDKEIFFEMSRDFYSCGAAHKPIPEENRINFWKELVSGNFITGYIIEFNGETAGYALIAFYASQEYGGKIALLDELYIKPAFRGQGIAKKVFKAVETSGIVACRLEAEPTNVRAIKLYESLGYEKFDYIQMSKKIKGKSGE